MRRRILAAMLCGSVLAGGSAPALSQSVVDAKGKQVGTLFDSMGGVQRVLRRVSTSTWIAVPFVTEGFYNYGLATEYLYQSANCTGIGYLDNDLNVAVQSASYYPLIADARFGTTGTLVYGGDQRMRLAVYSTRTRFNPGGAGDGPCSPVAGEMRSVRQAVEYDLKGLALTMPFKLK